MPKAAPVKTVRRSGRTATAATTRKTVNRFANLAGGDTTNPLPPSPDADQGRDEFGLIGAMSEADRHGRAVRVVEIPLSATAPHPFNDPDRSQPCPEDGKWSELVRSIEVNGVRLPILAVPRDAFLAARPAATAQIPDDAQYILVYGHRRRAASLQAGKKTIPAVIDHAIMADDGDLDAMAAENLGRQDLSEWAEANLYARYSDLGLSQRAIAGRLGVDQATVSRRLALFLMAPEVRDAVADGRIRAADAATLAGALPYGPQRRWQKSKDAEQNTARRREEQCAALTLILERSMTAARAAEWILAARSARAQAEQWGIALVDDPRAELGERFYEHRVDEYDGSRDLIAALDPALGTLVLYARTIPDEETGAGGPVAETGCGNAEDVPGAPSSISSESDAESDAENSGSEDDRDPEPALIAEQRRTDADSAAAAQAHRRRSCAALAAQPISNADLLRILVRQYLSGVAARSGTSAVSALLDDWDACAEGEGERARAARAWHRAVAAAELHTTELADVAWDDDAVAHVRMLIDRVGYQPTGWEQQQLDRVAG